jgi:hypothetical protein
MNILLNYSLENSENVKNNYNNNINNKNTNKKRIYFGFLRKPELYKS